MENLPGLLDAEETKNPLRPQFLEIAARFPHSHSHGYGFPNRSCTRPANQKRADVRYLAAPRYGSRVGQPTNVNANGHLAERASDLIILLNLWQRMDGPPAQLGNGVLDAIVGWLRPIQFRGKARLTELVIPRNGLRKARVFGYRFSLDRSDFIQRHMYAGSFERVESAAVRKFVHPGMTFVDVGANVGYYTALAARLVGPSGSVLAFEPSEYAFPRLSKMIEFNHLTNVRAIKCGLADVAGEQILYGGVEEDLLNNHTATMVPNDNPNRTVVRTETLDRIAEQFNIRKIDFLKIDVDGFEPLVLKGAANLIAEGRISCVMLECLDFWLEKIGTSSADIIQQLQSRGYRRMSLKNSGNALFYL